MPVGYEAMGIGRHHVLALHGWFGDHATFAPMKDALSLDEFTYVCMDYRGYGKSKSLKGDYSLKEIARDALELADSLEWDTFSLIGHSMGGTAMQRVLADAPSRIRKLVGIAPVPATGVPFDDQTWGFFQSGVDSLDSRRGILDFSTGGRLSKSWLDRMARHSEATSTREAFAGYLQAWAKTDFSGEIKGKPQAVKVIVGDHDPSLTPDVMTATYLAFYPNAELEVIANAGHYPIDETPVALATSIEAFLRR